MDIQVRPIIQQNKTYISSNFEKAISKWSSILYDLQCMDEETICQYVTMFHDILLHPTWFCTHNILRSVRFSFHYSIYNLKDKEIFSYFRNKVAIFERDYTKLFLDTLENDVENMVEDIYIDLKKRYTASSDIIGSDILVYHEKDKHGQYLDWPHVFVVYVHFTKQDKN